MEERLALPAPRADSHEVLGILRRARTVLSRPDGWYGPEQYAAELWEESWGGIKEPSYFVPRWPVPPNERVSIQTALSHAAEGDQKLFDVANACVTKVVGCGNSPDIYDTLFDWSVKEGRAQEEVVLAVDETIRRMELGDLLEVPSPMFRPTPCTQRWRQSGKGRGGDRW